MIYNCDKCNKEINLMRGAHFCPVCGSKIHPIDFEGRVSKLHSEGKTDKEIAAELHVTEIVVGQTLAKAALNGRVEADVIQTEYADAIKKVMSDNWDGKTKSIKNAVPADCTYVTINYYVRKQRRENAEARTEKVREMIRAGRPVLEIAEELHLQPRSIETIMLQEIEKDRAVAEHYINPDYNDKIMDIISKDWDGRIKSIKDAIPDITYTNIKAYLAKNK